MLLVERRRADPVLYVDVDHDGGLSEAERYDLPRSGEVLVRMPLAGRAYPDYPVAFWSSWPGLKPRNKPERRVILQSLQVFIEGTVPIDRTGVRVRYTVGEDLKPSQYGWIGIDGQTRNGTIDENALSPESGFTGVRTARQSCA